MAMENTTSPSDHDDDDHDDDELSHLAHISVFALKVIYILRSSTSQGHVMYISVSNTSQS